MKFTMKLKIATWIFTAFFVSVAPPAWADCPTHATYPAPVDPDPDPDPTDDPDCPDDGSPEDPPESEPDPTEPSLPPEADGSGGSCPTNTCPDDEPQEPPGDVCPDPDVPPGPDPDCSNTQDSPISLPTMGERVRLHMVAGGGATPIRWGKNIEFGDGFRLNYLTYIQLTSDGRYLRIYDPTSNLLHNFRTDRNAPGVTVTDSQENGQPIRTYEYRDSYVGSAKPLMNRITLRIAGPVDGKANRIELIYPEGGSIIFEQDRFERIVGDLAGPIFRVAKRVTRDNHEMNFIYTPESVTIRDAAGHEYICRIDPDRTIGKIDVVSAGSSKSWVYNSGTNFVKEANSQNGISKEVRVNVYKYVSKSTKSGAGMPAITKTFYRGADGRLTAKFSSSHSSSYSYAKLSNDNIKRVETRNSVQYVTEYDKRGMVARTLPLGGTEAFKYNDKKKLEYYKDSLGREWRYTYTPSDQGGRMLSAVDPAGGEKHYAYLGLSKKITLKREKIGTNTWRESSYRYDSGEKLIEETHQIAPGRTAVTRYVRYPTGRAKFKVTKIDDTTWSATYYEYNAAGQITVSKGPYQITNPDAPENGVPANGKTYEYNPWGKLTSVTDENGDRRRYEYSANDRLAAIIDVFGNRTEYGYDNLGRKTSQTDSLGNKTEWVYNNLGQVTQIKGSSGVPGCTSCAMAADATDKLGIYTWLAGNLLSTYTDLEGRKVSYQYDAANRKIKEIDHLNNTTHFAYDTAGQLVSTTDPTGNTRQFSYNSLGRRVSETDAFGNISRHEFDLAGRLTAVRDAAGGETIFTHDLSGRVVSTRVKVDAAAWRESRNQYDLQGKLLERVEAYGTTDAVTTRFAYDNAGRQIRATLDPGGLALVTQTRYDAIGRIVGQIDANGNETVFTYDRKGRLVAATSPEGRRTAYEYDAVDRRTGIIVDPDGIAQTKVVAYDAAGNIIDESDGVVGLSYAFDKAGLRTRIITPGQYDVEMVYDHAKRLTEIRRKNRVDNVVVGIKREYDAAGRVIKTIDEANKATLYEYNANGQITKITDPLGAVTRLDYDAKGRQTRIVLPHGGERQFTYNLAGELVKSENGPEGRVEYRYDSLGRQIERIDANSRSRKIFFDKAGRIIRHENEMGQAVSYTYDKAGNRLTLADAKSNTTVFSYDRDGKIVGMTYPPVAGQPENSERYQYDNAGRIVCKTTPNGDSIRYRYDPAGNLAAVYHGAIVPDEQNIPTNRLIALYERNGAGEITKEEDPNTAMLYSYDEFGRLIEAKDQALNKSVRYGYDSRSLRNKMDVVDYSPSANGVVSMAVAYAYDNAGRLTSVKKDSDNPALYEYDLSGRRSKLTLPNGVVTAYTYDDADRLLELATTKDATVLAKFVYSFDPTGNRTGIAYADGSKSEYSFDNAYRLTRDKRVNAASQVLYDEAYTYDAVGNRLTKIRSGWNPVNVTYNYNTRNQLISTSGTEANIYAYDPSGNTIGKTSSSGNETMTYDVLGRLTRYQGPGGVEETIYRGSEWHRWNVTEQGAATSFLYDGDNVVADYEGANSLLSRHYVTPSLDENLSMTIASGLYQGAYYYAHDGLGSAIMLSDASGSFLNNYDYTSFGEQYSSTESVEQRYGYTGRERFNLMDGMHYRYRTYDPSSGRFPRRDPLGYGPDINLYSYVANMPYLYTDPFGLKLSVCGPKDFQETIETALKQICPGLSLNTAAAAGGCTPIKFDKCPDKNDSPCRGLYDITENGWPNTINPLDEDHPRPSIRYDSRGNLTKQADGKQKKGPGTFGKIYSPSGSLNTGDEVYSNIHDSTGSLRSTTIPLPAILAHELGHMSLVNRGAQPDRTFNQNRRDAISINWENQALKKIGSPWVRNDY